MRAVPARELCGSVPPLVTPFRKGEVDLEAYASQIEHQVRCGSHGLLVNGTSAEPSTLTIEERNRLVSTAVEVADGRLPVIAATGSQSFAETLELTRHAERAGADALLVVTPYYIRPPQRGLVQYYTELCRTTSLPVLIYHIPGRAAVGLELESLEQILEAAPNLVGMKHAVDDLGFVTRALERLGRGFRIFVGLEELSFPMLALGACGMMNAVANVDPARVAALYEAVAAGDLERARNLHYALAELNRSVFFDTNPIPVKYMMRRLGLLERNEHRLPMCPPTPELASRLDRVLAQAGLR
ncbi:MAG: 4-hydroxy-tetrahydrodipicolinate synthase [Myxococcota bacterium]